MINGETAEVRNDRSESNSAHSKGSTQFLHNQVLQSFESPPSRLINTKFLLLVFTKMSSGNSRAPRVVRNNSVHSPAASFYAMAAGKRLVLKKSVPYALTDKGMGIRYTEKVSHHDVFVTDNDNQDKIRFNEPKNAYGLYFASLMMAEGRRKKDEAPEPDSDPEPEEGVAATPKKRASTRVSELEIFQTVWKSEYARLADMAGYAPEPSNDKRFMSRTWDILRGFNTDDEVNPQLDEILANFVHVRLGLYPFPLDEFKAAVKAIQIYFLDHTKDNKNAGNGVWTFPAIHMLHGHMIQRGITPFSFDPNDAKDEEVRLGIRAKNSKSIWTTAKKTKAAADDPGKKVLCKIETRGSVIQELIGFVNNFYGHDIEGPVEDEGPDPAEATRTEQDPATKRLKRTFHLG